MKLPVYSDDSKQESVFNFAKNLDSFMTSKKH